jgi:hypothetical protein
MIAGQHPDDAHLNGIGIADPFQCSTHKGCDVFTITAKILLKLAIGVLLIMVDLFRLKVVMRSINLQKMGRTKTVNNNTFSQHETFRYGTMVLVGIRKNSS